MSQPTEIQRVLENGLFECLLCSRTFQTRGGCSLHQRRAHAERYHALGAATAVAEAERGLARIWTVENDRFLWANNEALRDLVRPAARRLQELSARCARTVDSVRLRLVHLRRNPPVVSGEEVRCAREQQIRIGLEPATGSCRNFWTDAEQEALWQRFCVLERHGLRREATYEILACEFGRSKGAISHRVALLRASGHTVLEAVAEE